MGYKKNKAEIDRLESQLSAPFASGGRVLYLPFDTDENFIREVLPPGLIPNGGTGSLTVGQWRGSNAGPYSAAFLMVSAKLERDVAKRGAYCLSFFISSEPAALFGRPMMGEPKKLADINFSVQQRSVQASVHRLGTELISVRAELGEELPPRTTTSLAFWYKHQPACDGMGLQYDPQLLVQTNTQKTDKLQASAAQITLRSSLHDPVGDVPIHAVKPAYYSEGDITAACDVVQIVDKEQFLPFAFSGYDNWNYLSKSGALDEEHCL